MKTVKIAYGIIISNLTVKANLCHKNDPLYFHLNVYLYLIINTGHQRTFSIYGSELSCPAIIFRCFFFNKSYPQNKKNVHQARKICAWKRTINYKTFYKRTFHPHILHFATSVFLSNTSTCALPNAIITDFLPLKFVFLLELCLKYKETNRYRINGT